MSLFARGSAPEQRMTVEEALSAARAGHAPTYSGAVVTPETALRLSTVWACEDLISSLASTLPVAAVRYAGGVRRAVDPTPKIIAAPSAEIDPFEWRRQVLTSWLARGNVFGWVCATDASGWPTQVEILNPDVVTYSVRPDGSVAGWYVNGNPVGKWPAGPLWHEGVFTPPGTPIGRSVIEYARQSIGLGLGAEEFGARWFGDGAHPSAILSTDAKIDDRTARTIKTRFTEAVRGRREPAVLGSGFKYDAISTPANESQFLETIKANVGTIARFYRVPPEMVGGDSGSSMTYANVEQRGLDLLTFTVRVWIARLDGALSRLLPRPVVARTDPDALLAVDAKARVEIQATRLRAGLSSVNRELEAQGLEGIGPDGDRFNWPPMSTGAGSSSSQTDPTATGDQPTPEGMTR